MKANESRQSDKELGYSPNPLAGIIASAMDAIIVTDDSQRIILFNEAAERIFACPANDAIGSSVERFIPQRFRAAHRRRVRRFAESGTTNRTFQRLGTLWGLRATGEEFPIEASISKTESAGENLLTAVIRDITERIRSEETLRKSEERFRLAAQAGRMFAYEWDAATDLITRSPESAHILGINEAVPITGQQVLAKVHPDDRERLKDAVAALSPEKPDLHISYRMIRPDNTVIWVERTSCAHFDEQGKLLRIIGMVADITERHRAEEAVRESEQRFRLVADTAPALMWMSGTDKLCNYFNKPWLDFTGRSIEEELGNGWAEGVHPDDLQRCLDVYTQSFDKREKFKMEYRLRHHDGEYRWILDIGVPRFNQDGSFAGYIGIGIDVADRKLAEEALFRANERLELAIDSGSAGGWDFDLKTDRNVWFGKAHAQLGMTPDETLGSRQEFWDRVHKDDREHLQHAMQAAKDKHEEFTEDFRVVWRDGTTRWLRARGRFHYAANGEPERMLGISLDITELKLAEEARLRLAAIVESSDDGISSVTLDGVIATWNAGAQRMFAYTENEAVGKPANIIVPPELRDEQKTKIFERLWSGGRIEQFETVRISKTGKRIDVSLSISPIKDSTGKIVGCAGIARDITTRKRAEEALVSSEQRYRLLFERNVAGVAIGSLDGQVLDCNEGWARILGYQSRDELLGRNASELYFDRHDRQPLLDELLEKSAVFSRELQLKRKDGSPVWVLFNAAALHAEHGAPILQATMIDISDWKRSEQALADMTRRLIESQEQERARIGRELHDDINQRLALLSIELEQLQHDPSAFQNRVQELRKSVAELSNDVQALSHDLHSSKLEYLGVVAGMKSWCKEFGERHKVEIDFRSDVPGAVSLKVGLPLFRVIQEALNNAIKHSGVKRFEMQLREDSGEIHLVISDSGRGFDVEAASRGKGLGLTSMRERIRLVNGTISIESKPMAGTTIHVRVPLRSKQEYQRAAGSE